MTHSAQTASRRVGAGRILPANIIMAVFSLGVSARLVVRFGIRASLSFGLLVAAAFGLLLFARSPTGGTFVLDVLPGMLLMGLGAGIAFNPVLWPLKCVVAAYWFRSAKTGARPPRPRMTNVGSAAFPSMKTSKTVSVVNSAIWPTASRRSAQCA